MRILSHYYYSNNYDTRQIEQKYIDVFKTTLNSIRAYSKSFINEELDRQLEFELRDFSNKILGCFLYDYLNDNIDSEDMECEFCKKKFSSKSNLRYHIKTNKKCQEIQLQQNKDNIVFENVNCEFCDKNFTKQTIKIHHKTCKKKIDIELKNLISDKDTEIKNLKKENKKIKNLLSEKVEENKKLQMRIIELETENKIYLQDRDLVQKLATQPKTTNNDNRIRINNNFFDNPERIKQMIDEKLTKDYISDGQKGVAQFACKNLLKDENGNMNYICSDLSRHIFKYQNSEGNIEKDVKANKLTNMLIEAGITHKTLSVAPSLWTEEDGNINSNKFQTYSPYTSEITAMQLDNSIFRNELATLTSF
jgi:hypothetical protein